MQKRALHRGHEHLEDNQVDGSSSCLEANLKKMGEKEKTVILLVSWPSYETFHCFKFLLGASVKSVVLKVKLAL